VFVVSLLSYISGRQPLSRDVRQVKDTAHDGDNVPNGHEHVRPSENPMHGHVMRALSQLAQIAAAHFLAQARRLLDSRLGGDETQHCWHHVQPDRQFQQKAQTQRDKLWCEKIREKQNY